MTIKKILVLKNLTKDTLVKVVFFHSEMPESWYSTELGIVHSVNKQKEQVKVRVITEGYSADNIEKTTFIRKRKKQRIVNNKAFQHYDRFNHLEPFYDMSMESLKKNLNEFYQKERKKLDQLRDNVTFLDTISQTYTYSSDPF